MDDFWKSIESKLGFTKKDSKEIWNATDDCRTLRLESNKVVTFLLQGSGEVVLYLDHPAIDSSSVPGDNVEGVKLTETVSGSKKLLDGLLEGDLVGSRTIGDNCIIQIATPENEVISYDFGRSAPGLENVYPADRLTPEEIEDVSCVMHIREKIIDSPIENIHNARKILEKNSFQPGDLLAIHKEDLSSGMVGITYVFEKYALSVYAFQAVRMRAPGHRYLSECTNDGELVHINPDYNTEVLSATI